MATTEVDTAEAMPHTTKNEVDDKELLATEYGVAVDGLSTEDLKKIEVEVAKALETVEVPTEAGIRPIEVGTQDSDRASEGGSFLETPSVPAIEGKKAFIESHGDTDIAHTDQSQVNKKVEEPVRLDTLESEVLEGKYERKVDEREENGAPEIFKHDLNKKIIPEEPAVLYEKNLEVTAGSKTFQETSKEENFIDDASASKTDGDYKESVDEVDVVVGVPDINNLETVTESEQVEGVRTVAPDSIMEHEDNAHIEDEVLRTEENSVTKDSIQNEEKTTDQITKTNEECEESTSVEDELEVPKLKNSSDIISAKAEAKECDDTDRLITDFKEEIATDERHIEEESTSYEHIIAKEMDLSQPDLRETRNVEVEIPEKDAGNSSCVTEETSSAESELTDQTSSELKESRADDSNVSITEEQAITGGTTAEVETDNAKSSELLESQEPVTTQITTVENIDTDKADDVQVTELHRNDEGEVAIESSNREDSPPVNSVTSELIEQSSEVEAGEESSPSSITESKLQDEAYKPERSDAIMEEVKDETTAIGTDDRVLEPTNNVGQITTESHEDVTALPLDDKNTEDSNEEELYDQVVKEISLTKEEPESSTLQEAEEPKSSFFFSSEEVKEATASDDAPIPATNMVEEQITKSEDYDASEIATTRDTNFETKDLIEEAEISEVDIPLKDAEVEETQAHEMLSEDAGFPVAEEKEDSEVSAASNIIESTTSELVPEEVETRELILAKTAELENPKELDSKEIYTAEDAETNNKEIIKIFETEDADNSLNQVAADSSSEPPLSEDGDEKESPKVGEEETQLVVEKKTLEIVEQLPVVALVEIKETEVAEEDIQGNDAKVAETPSTDNSPSATLEIPTEQDAGSVTEEVKDEISAANSITESVSSEQAPDEVEAREQILEKTVESEIPQDLDSKEIYATVDVKAKNDDIIQITGKEDAESSSITGAADRSSVPPLSVDLLEEKDIRDVVEQITVVDPDVAGETKDKAVVLEEEALAQSSEINLDEEHYTPEEEKQDTVSTIEQATDVLPEDAAEAAPLKDEDEVAVLVSEESTDTNEENQTAKKVSPTDSANETVESLEVETLDNSTSVSYVTQPQIEETVSMDDTKLDELTEEVKVEKSLEVVSEPDPDASEKLEKTSEPDPDDSEKLTTVSEPDPDASENLEKTSEPDPDDSETLKTVSEPDPDDSENQDKVKVADKADIPKDSDESLNKGDEHQGETPAAEELETVSTVNEIANQSISFESPTEVASELSVEESVHIEERNYQIPELVKEEDTEPQVIDANLSPQDEIIVSITEPDPESTTEGVSTNEVTEERNIEEIPPPAEEDDIKKEEEVQNFAAATEKEDIETDVSVAEADQSHGLEVVDQKAEEEVLKDAAEVPVTSGVDEQEKKLVEIPNETSEPGLTASSVNCDQTENDDNIAEKEAADEVKQQDEPKSNDNITEKENADIVQQDAQDEALEHLPTKTEATEVPASTSSVNDDDCIPILKSEEAPDEVEEKDLAKDYDTAEDSQIAFQVDEKEMENEALSQEEVIQEEGNTSVKETEDAEPTIGSVNDENIVTLIPEKVVGEVHEKGLAKEDDEIVEDSQTAYEADTTTLDQIKNEEEASVKVVSEPDPDDSGNLEKTSEPDPDVSENPKKFQDDKAEEKINTDEVDEQEEGQVGQLPDKTEDNEPSGSSVTEDYTASLKSEEATDEVLEEVKEIDEANGNARVQDRETVNALQEGEEGDKPEDMPGDATKPTVNDDTVTDTTSGEEAGTVQEENQANDNEDAKETATELVREREFEVEAEPLPEVGAELSSATANDDIVLKERPATDAKETEAVIVQERELESKAEPLLEVDAKLSDTNLEDDTLQVPEETLVKDNEDAMETDLAALGQEKEPEVEAEPLSEGDAELSGTAQYDDLVQEESLPKVDEDDKETTTELVQDREPQLEAEPVAEGAAELPGATETADIVQVQEETLLKDNENAKETELAAVGQEREPEVEAELLPEGHAQLSGTTENADVVQEESLPKDYEDAKETEAAVVQEREIQVEAEPLPEGDAEPSGTTESDGTITALSSKGEAEDTLDEGKETEKAEDANSKDPELSISGEDEENNTFLKTDEDIKDVPEEEMKNDQVGTEEGEPAASNADERIITVKSEENPEQVQENQTETKPTKDDDETPISKCEQDSEKVKEVVQHGTEVIDDTSDITEKVTLSDDLVQEEKQGDVLENLPDKSVDTEQRASSVNDAPLEALQVITDKSQEKEEDTKEKEITIEELKLASEEVEATDTTSKTILGSEAAGDSLEDITTTKDASVDDDITVDSSEEVVQTTFGETELAVAVPGEAVPTAELEISEDRHDASVEKHIVEEHAVAEQKSHEESNRDFTLTDIRAGEKTENLVPDSVPDSGDEIHEDFTPTETEEGGKSESLGPNELPTSVEDAQVDSITTAAETEREKNESVEFESAAGEEVLKESIEIETPVAAKLESLEPIQVLTAAADGGQESTDEVKLEKVEAGEDVEKSGNVGLNEVLSSVIEDQKAIKVTDAEVEEEEKPESFTPNDSTVSIEEGKDLLTAETEAKNKPQRRETEEVPSTADVVLFNVTPDETVTPEGKKSDEADIIGGSEEREDLATGDNDNVLGESQMESFTVSTREFEFQSTEENRTVNEADMKDDILSEPADGILPYTEKSDSVSLAEQIDRTAEKEIQTKEEVETQAHAVAEPEAGITAEEAAEISNSVLEKGDEIEKENEGDGYIENIKETQNLGLEEATGTTTEDFVKEEVSDESYVDKEVGSSIEQIKNEETIGNSTEEVPVNEGQNSEFMSSESRNPEVYYVAAVVDIKDDVLPTPEPSPIASPMDEELTAEAAHEKSKNLTTELATEVVLESEQKGKGDFSGEKLNESVQQEDELETDNASDRVEKYGEKTCSELHKAATMGKTEVVESSVPTESEEKVVVDELSKEAITVSPADQKFEEAAGIKTELLVEIAETREAAPESREVFAQDDQQLKEADIEEIPEIKLLQQTRVVQVLNTGETGVDAAIGFVSESTTDHLSGVAELEVDEVGKPAEYKSSGDTVEETIDEGKSVVETEIQHPIVENLEVVIPEDKTDFTDADDSKSTLPTPLFEKASSEATSHKDDNAEDLKTDPLPAPEAKIDEAVQPQQNTARSLDFIEVVPPAQPHVPEEEVKIQSESVGTEKPYQENNNNKAEAADSSLSDLLQISPKDTIRMASQHNQETYQTSKKLDLHTEDPKTDEDKDDEDEEEGDEHKKTDSASSDGVIVEASKDIEVKSPHKKHHGILSGVGSKVKNSISKVKKAITGKSSHPKPPSPKE